MRVEQAKGAPNDVLVAVLVDLALVVAVLLSMWSVPAPTKHAMFFIEAAKLASITPDGTSPGAAIAEGSSLDLQLDWTVEKSVDSSVPLPEL